MIETTNTEIGERVRICYNIAKAAKTLGFKLKQYSDIAADFKKC